MAVMTDPIGILVERFAQVLIRSGKAPMSAYLEAEDLTVDVLEDMRKVGADVGHLLRRIQIYHLRTRGIEPSAICIRLGVNRCYVHKAYKKELLRRRYAA